MIKTYAFVANIVAMSMMVAAGPACAEEPAAVVLIGATPIADGALDHMTAREDLTVIASSDQNASVNGNVVSGTSTTGRVNISGNALQNARGLVLVSANSGNNVSINSALTVSVMVNPLD